MSVVDRFTQAPEAVAPKGVFALKVIFLANLAEQSAAEDGFPNSWLHTFVRTARSLDKRHGRLPAVVAASRSALFTDNRLVEDYRLALDALGNGDYRAAETLLLECEKRCGILSEPLLWRSIIALGEGHRAISRSFASRAGERLRMWGTSWDKRLKFEQWCRLASSLAKGEYTRGPLIQCSDLAYLALWAGGDHDYTFAGPCATRLDLYVRAIETKSDLRTLNTYPLPKGPEWYRSNQFPICKEMEEHFETIRAEVLGLANSGHFHAEAERIGRSGSWDVCILYERGRKNIEACVRCPTVTRLIEQHETVRTLAGLIYVSKLSAGGSVAPHYGPTNMRIRCHLGIQIPVGDCAIRVGGETRRWETGKCLVFDDYYEHEVWNHTAEDRVVLIVDLWRPELAVRERRFVEGIQHYAQLQAQNLNSYWGANEKRKTEKRVGYD